MFLQRPLWERDGQDWPHREASRFVTAAGIRWHIQQFGSGPPALLVHGTGAASHTWRALAPLLARQFALTVVDLPGHGFTELPHFARMALPTMAADLGALLQTLDVTPSLVIGHSAGAAILVRMCLDGQLTPQRLISLNGALLPFAGAAGAIFPVMAKLLAISPLVPQIVAWHGYDHRAIERLVQSTGSTLDARGIELYARLIRRTGHVQGVLAMMANWDLAPLAADLCRLTVPILLVVAEHDRTVAPSEAEQVLRRLPDAYLLRLPGLGHLAHEEAPAAVFRVIARALDWAVPPPCLSPP